MPLKPLTSCLVLSLFCACGPGPLPTAGSEDVPPLTEPARVDAPIGASVTAAPPAAQRFALTSSSTDGWSLEQHAAVARANADFTLNAVGCRGGLSNQINSTRFTFCAAGSDFATLDDVPNTVSDCQHPASSVWAGGSYGEVAIGHGFVVLRDGVAVGRLRIADHTFVPEFWDGSPVQVTLEFVADR